MMLGRLLVLGLLILRGSGFRLVMSVPRTVSQTARLRSGLQLIGVGSATVALLLGGRVEAVRAVSGAVQKATASETQQAARKLQKMAKQVVEMEEMGAKAEWEGVAAILSSRDFVDFDKIANVLVRSDEVSAEDKVALGTIKRYGVVADALIMMGGLGSVLRAGGVKGMSAATSAYADQAAILDDDETAEDDEVKTVDTKEAVKFIKLIKGSLADINRIVANSRIQL